MTIGPFFYLALPTSCFLWPCLFFSIPSSLFTFLSVPTSLSVYSWFSFMYLYMSSSLTLHVSYIFPTPHSLSHPLFWPPKIYLSHPCCNDVFNPHNWHSQPDTRRKAQNLSFDGPEFNDWDLATSLNFAFNALLGLQSSAWDRQIREHQEHQGEYKEAGFNPRQLLSFLLLSFLSTRVKSSLWALNKKIIAEFWWWPYTYKLFTVCELKTFHLDGPSAL